MSIYVADARGWTELKLRPYEVLRTSEVVATKSQLNAKAHVGWSMELPVEGALAIVLWGTIGAQEGLLCLFRKQSMSASWAQFC